MLDLSDPTGVSKVLHDKGLRATPQRMAVLVAIGQLSHPAAEEVARLVMESYPTLSLATVYNTLDTLENQGLIRCFKVEGRRRFDLRTEAHHHLWCTKCQRMDDVPAATAPGCEDLVDTGWKVEDVIVTYKGVCPRCQARSNHAGA